MVGTTVVGLTELTKLFPLSNLPNYMSRVLPKLIEELTLQRLTVAA
jgi:hypothetical protein